MFIEVQFEWEHSIFYERFAFEHKINDCQQQNSTTTTFTIYYIKKCKLMLNHRSTKKTGRYSQDMDVDGWNEIKDIVDRIRNKLLEESQIGEYRMNSKVKFAL